MNRKIEIDENGPWYHGSNQKFKVPKTGNSVTQWRELAEAFSHRPGELEFDDDGNIRQNGTEYGYLYVVDEPVRVGADLYRHPKTTMGVNIEFLTGRDLKVRIVKELPVSPGWKDKEEKPS